jgi:uncharacterized repeat protein (TIGR01451 family)
MKSLKDMKKSINKIYGICIICLFAISLGAQTYQTKWERHIGGKSDELLTNSIITKSGFIMMIGTSESTASGEKSQNTKGNSDIWLVKMNRDGQIIWEKTYVVDSSSETDCKLIELNDKSFIISSVSSDRNISGGDKSAPNIGMRDIWLLRIDSNGNKIWDKPIGGSLDEIGNVGLTLRDTTILISCSSRSDSSGTKSQNKRGIYDYWVVKMDYNGNKIWDRTFGGDSLDILHKIFAFDKGYMLFGLSNSTASSDKSQNSSGRELWAVYIDSNGSKIWDKTLVGDNNTSVYIYLINNSFYLLKRTSDTILNDTLVRLDKNLNTVWEVGCQKGYLLDQSKWFGESNIYFRGSAITYIYDTIGSLIDSININHNNSLHSIFNYNQDFIITGTEESVIFPYNNDQRSDYVIRRLSIPNKSISGKIYPDFNNNCSFDTNEYNIENQIIYNTIDKNYVISKNNSYTVYLFDRDTAILKLVSLDSNMYVGCGADSIRVDMKSTYDTSDINFPIQSNKTGTNLKINSYSHVILRPGRWADYQLSFQNLAFDTARNAYIEIEVDSLQLDSIISTSTYTRNGNKLHFNLGSIRPLKADKISYSIKLKTNVIIGSLLCHRATIYPIGNIYLKPNYDSSKINISSRCLTNDSIEIQLMNIGSKNQGGTGEIISYEDELILKVDSFRLNTGSSRIFKYKLDSNKLFTALVYNKNFDPIQPILIRQLDKCALHKPTIVNSPALKFYRQDDAKEYEEDCDIVRGSYDPNLKSVMPVGMFSEHYTATGSILKYRLDFQNTGTDTAFKVVLIDTLSPYLDIASIEPGIGSHNYRIEIVGRVVKFIFDPIFLVDSITNEGASHGYVTFKIKHVKNIVPKTVISNKVDIYFDFNDPVRTNSVFNSIFDTIQIYVPKGGNGSNSILGINKEIVSIYPNPASEKIVISLDEKVKDLAIELIDIQGKLVKKFYSKNQQTLDINIQDLQKGNYILRCVNENKLIVIQKIQIN